MTQYYFNVVLEPDREEPHRYNVRVPALPGCPTYGGSIEDALANAREAITEYIGSLRADGEAIPDETHPAQSTIVVVTPET